MNKDDFYSALWTTPILSGFIGFVLGNIFQTNEMAICILLGIAAGYLFLISFMFGKKYIIEVKKEDSV